MEHAVTALADGTVSEVFVAKGELVDGGADLLAFAPALPTLRSCGQCLETNFGTHSVLVFCKCATSLSQIQHIGKSHVVQSLGSCARYSTGHISHAIVDDTVLL